MSKITFVVDVKDIQSGQFGWEELKKMSINLGCLVYIRNYAVISEGKIFYVN